MLVARDSQSGASEGEISLPDFVPCCYNPSSEEREADALVAREVFEDLSALPLELMPSPITEG